MALGAAMPAFTILALVCSPFAIAQGKAIPRVAFYGAGAAANDVAYVKDFRTGMAELGRGEGKDYVVDEHYADNVASAMDPLAATLVASKPDLLLTVGDQAARVLARHTRSVPIVFAGSIDP